MEIDNLLISNLLISWQLTILIGLTLVRGLIYLSIFPPWVAPDEPAHFEAIRILGQEQQLPSRDYYESRPINPELSDSFQTFRMWALLERSTPTDLLSNRQVDVSFIDYPYPGKWVYAETYPLLPHLLLSPVSRLAASLDIAAELYLLRLNSVVLAIVVTILAWLISRRVFPDQPQFWLAIPAFIVFLPMHTHVFASLNTDVFAIVLASALLLLLISFFDQDGSKLKPGKARGGLPNPPLSAGFTTKGSLAGANPDLLKLILTASLLVLALFTKRTLVFTLLWVGVTAILYQGYRRNWPLKRVIAIGLATITSLGLALWLVILNAHFLANSVFTLFNMKIGQRLPFERLIDQQLSASEMIRIFIKSGLFAFITFWGDFGGATINIPWPWAWGLMLFCGFIIGGAFFYSFKLFRRPFQAGGYQQNVFLIFITGIILSLLNAFFPVLVAGPTWGPPARYFFPVIIPIAVFFFVGAWQLCPAKYRQSYLLPVWLIGLVTYDTLVMTQVLIPFLYG